MDDNQNAAADQPILQPEPDPVVEEAPAARDRIRAFEDEHLGPDVGRINGEIEKGHGSPFKLLSHDQHRHYADLERLAAAEASLNEAAGTLAQAQSAYDAAAAKVENSAIATDEPQPEPAQEV